jgi:hypothetical protein
MEQYAKSEHQPQSKLNLPWGISVGGLQEIGDCPVLAGEMSEGQGLIDLHELCGRVLKAIVGDSYYLGD